MVKLERKFLWTEPARNRRRHPETDSAAPQPGACRGAVSPFEVVIMSKALVVISFGTSFPRAVEDIEGVERALRRVAPYHTFVRAFTSSMIRGSLAQRGKPVPGLTEALRDLATRKYTNVVVQPTHLLPGKEYAKLKAEASEMVPLFDSLKVGRPLLDDKDSLRTLAEGLSKAYPSGQETVLFMGHGTDHFANLVYPALQTAFYFQKRKDLLVATVEGWPTLEDWIDQLAGKPVRLVPLMLVAGNHALNDMAGEEAGSWNSRLRAVGCDVRCTLTGLGSLPWVQEMYQQKLLQLL